MLVFVGVRSAFWLETILVVGGLAIDLIVLLHGFWFWLPILLIELTVFHHFAI